MNLARNMYVRCPIIEREHLLDPREFIVGQIVSIDEFAETVSVRFFDPFNYRAYYPDIPQIQEYPITMIKRCELIKGTKISCRHKEAHVFCIDTKTEEEYRYYIIFSDTRKIANVSESEIEAPFTEGRISPLTQLKNYEFQNPSWYIGRSVVARVKKVLDNSVLGFQELAGCKIYLMPHQLNSIMRCFQEKNCRYMLADEVGMGKTIEASAVLKLYLQNNTKKTIVIIVPDSLKEQWRIELFLKFDISQGKDLNENDLELISFSEFQKRGYKKGYDFVIIDEVHRLIADSDYFEDYHKLSKNSYNVLLLSATPLQKRTDDYLYLLRLLDPNKYDVFSVSQFSDLVSLQATIISKVMGVMDDIDDLQDEINENEMDTVNNNRKCLDLFDDITDGLQDIAELINDEAYNRIILNINNEDEGLGIGKMQIAVSYVCDNYQIERCIIRNRRNILQKEDYASQTRPIRKLHKVLKYQSRTNEFNTYELLIDLMDKDSNRTKESLMKTYKPLLNAYFSSASAFLCELNQCNDKRIKNDKKLLESAKKWQLEELNTVNNIADILDNPDNYEDRIIKVIDYLDQELYKEKIVIFTSYEDTFNLYVSVLGKIYNQSEIAFFNSNMTVDELELSVYRFQNEKECRILLCDKSGGEGRNFQIADYIVHVDLPWDANEIEQRIGRLDRLERDYNRPNVYSVVVLSEDSIEQQLFDFWNTGLNVFEESLSGLEIVLEDINDQMFSAMAEDVKYGLFNVVPRILETTNQLKKEIKREQRFDTIGYLYKPINKQINRLIRYYIKNDNELFSSTMLTWASLAGFRHSSTNNIVRFSASDFSLNSARNTLLIPPDWTSYLQSRQNAFATRISNLYDKYKTSGLSDGKSIKGTFNRKTAIDSDYLHFFAPGDAIFDCIVNNAMRSTKGQCTAFAMKSEINWKGFIYTFSVEPNEKILLASGISPSEIASFRNFLTSDIVVIPVALEGFHEVDIKDVLREYEKIIQIGYKAVHNSVDHLGRRGKGKGGFLLIPQKYNVSNLEWFKGEFPPDLWQSLVETSYEYGKKIARKELARKSHLSDAKEEIQRLIAAKISTDTFYNRTESGLAELEAKYNIIYESIKSPRFSLESASFVWMVK